MAVYKTNERCFDMKNRTKKVLSLVIIGMLLLTGAAGCSTGVEIKEHYEQRDEGNRDEDNHTEKSGIIFCYSDSDDQIIVSFGIHGDHYEHLDNGPYAEQYAGRTAV